MLDLLLTKRDDLGLVEPAHLDVFRREDLGRVRVQIRSVSRGEGRGARRSRNETIPDPPSSIGRGPLLSLRIVRYSPAIQAQVQPGCTRRSEWRSSPQQILPRLVQFPRCLAIPPPFILPVLLAVPVPVPIKRWTSPLDRDDPCRHTPTRTLSLETPTVASVVIGEGITGAVAWMPGPRIAILLRLGLLGRALGSAFARGGVGRLGQGRLGLTR
jgi:hypothetical protein